MTVESVRARRMKNPSATAEKARRYVQDNLSLRCSLQDVAQEIGVPRYDLNRAFEFERNLRFRNYVRAYKLARATEMVEAGVKMAAVAMLVGYRSKKNFYRQWKRAFGVTPTTYRQTYRDREELQLARAQVFERAA